MNLDLDTTVTLSKWAVLFLGGVATPLLTALITRADASPSFKATFGGFLVALYAVVAAVLAAGGTFVLGDVVLVFLTTLATHQTTYTWAKALGDGLHPLQRLVPGGIGSPARPVDVRAA